MTSRISEMLGLSSRASTAVRQSKTSPRCRHEHTRTACVRAASLCLTIPMSRSTHLPRDGATSLHFTCYHCRCVVPRHALGTEHRNHCPFCLWSSHVDRTSGDRQCACHGPMEPITIWVRPDGEWAIVHRCTRCSTLRFNRIAGDDDPQLLTRLAIRPLTHPAFPLDPCMPLGSSR